MKERAMMFGAALAAALALGGAALGAGAARWLGAESEQGQERAWRAAAASAGRVAAAQAAQEACARGPLEKPGPGAAKTQALCQWERPASARPADGAARLAGAAAREGARREEFLSLALAAYERSRAFDDARASLAPSRAISAWQQAELARGRVAPAQAARVAEEALARLDRSIQEELLEAKRSDGGFWVFWIAPGALDAARQRALEALAQHWQTVYPESLRGAQEMLAAGEPSGMEALRGRSEQWAQERLEGLEASAEAADPEASGGAGPSEP